MTPEKQPRVVTADKISEADLERYSVGTYDNGIRMDYGDDPWGLLVYERSYVDASEADSVRVWAHLKSGEIVECLPPVPPPPTAEELAAKSMQEATDRVLARQQEVRAERERIQELARKQEAEALFKKRIAEQVALTASKATANAPVVPLDLGERYAQCEAIADPAERRAYYLNNIHGKESVFAARQREALTT